MNKLELSSCLRVRRRRPRHNRRRIGSPSTRSLGCRLEMRIVAQVPGRICRIVAHSLAGRWGFVVGGIFCQFWRWAQFWRRGF